MRIHYGFLVLVFWLCACPGLHADSAKIMKVLPHHLDLQGRHSLSPSLYERDAYQAFLRENPEKASGLQFDINWKAKRRRASAGPLRLRIELRTSARDLANPLVVESDVRPNRFFSTWSSLRVPEKDYKSFGQLIAWRATLWEGEVLLAEERSFLW